ncbi:hypothetical protein BGZ49_006209 [Haplosporangium sp. Z 27]|nr:hypothetical protein BGZ49_006209 [Haplosporangium sp. Z 27]
MPPPHGCIPPHLYYKVVISEYDYDENEYRYSNIKEWIIPFVHRIGDGKDDAGGLTSAYTILQDLEDADDYGAFLEHKLQRSPLDDDVDSTSTSNNSYNNNDTPSLYACTQVLISEQRTLQVLERHVFNSSRTNNGSNSKCSDRSRSNVDNENYSGSIERLPKALHELQGLLKKHPAKDTTTLTSVQLPYCVLKSDMKIILPNP